MYSTRRVHFIGVCGVGMSPLAEIAAKVGFDVSGSDQSNAQEGERLRQAGVKFSPDHNIANLGSAQTIIYSSAIPLDNPELAEARRRQDLQLLHRSDFLAELMAPHHAITVAGTHGKTTTAAMIAHMLAEMGLSPLAAIGGKLLSVNSYCLVGDGDLFVAESDESDGSLLKYQPLVGILSNIAKDHMDYFKDENQIIDLFRNYLGNIAPDGTAIIGWDNPLSRQLGSEFKGAKLAYGFTLGCDVRGRDYSPTRDGIKFTAQVERDPVPCWVPTLGKVNAINALCALAVARALDLDVRQAAEALATFRGVGRRLNIVFNNDHLRVVDDYAHNPDKIAGAIAAVKDAWPQSTVVVCFQPHRFSRISNLFEEFAASFSKADKVMVLPVYGAGEASLDGYDPSRIATQIALKSQVNAIAMGDFKSCVDYLSNEPSQELSVLTVGAGDVTHLAELIKRAFDGKTGK